MKTYHPVPLTSRAALSPQLEEIIEAAAALIHDEWAAARIANGWRYGPRRSDEEKTNPCIVPFGDLPESEKAYDRITARAAVHAILLSGYEIRRRRGD